MALTSSTERGFSGPPEAGLTPADAIVKAQAMASALMPASPRPRNALITPMTPMPSLSNGFFRLLVPRRYDD